MCNAMQLVHASSLNATPSNTLPHSSTLDFGGPSMATPTPAAAASASRAIAAATPSNNTLATQPGPPLPVPPAATPSASPAAAPLGRNMAIPSIGTIGQQASSSASSATPTTPNSLAAAVQSPNPATTSSNTLDHSNHVHANHPNSLHPAGIHLLRDDPMLSPPPTSLSAALMTDLQHQLGIDQTTLDIMGTEQPPPMLIPCPARAVGKWSFKLTPWNWTPFTPGSSSDTAANPESATDPSNQSNTNNSNGFVLHHWTRGDATTDSDSSTNRFAAFSTRPKPDIVTYTAEEYNQVLVDDAWTKPDTDHLFDLCRQFDVRFPIIADRYCAPSGRARDMEDLKARYVDVTRRVLARLRHPLANPPTKALLNALHFDPEKERIRKSHVRTLQARSQADVDEEDRLHALLLDIEAHQILVTRERTEVLSRFFKGYDPQYMADYNAQRSEYKEKMMVNGVASTLVTIDGILNYGEQAKLTPGVSVRSAGIRSLKPAVVARIGPIMQGMYKIRPSTLPIMCTSRLAAAFEETRSAIIHKLDLQKQVEKAEADLRGMRGGSVGTGYGAGSHLGKGLGKGSGAAGLAHHDKRAMVGSSPHPMGDGRDRKRARRN